MDSSRHAGKIAVVTGAGSGIGWATALRLGREGAQVIGCDIVEPALVETKATLEQAGLTAELVTADVTRQRTSTGSWLRQDRASTSSPTSPASWITSSHSETSTTRRGIA